MAHDDESGRRIDHTHAVETHPSAAEVGPGYETRDTNVRGILIFVVGLVVTLVLVQVALWGLLRAITGRPEPATPLAAPDVINDQRRALVIGEAEALAGAGPGRLPIEQAVERIARDGLPVGKGPARTEVQLNSHDGTPAPRSGDDPGTARDANRSNAPGGRKR